MKVPHPCSLKETQFRRKLSTAIARWLCDEYGVPSVKMLPPRKAHHYQQILYSTAGDNDEHDVEVFINIAERSYLYKIDGHPVGLETEKPRTLFDDFNYGDDLFNLLYSQALSYGRDKGLL